VLDGDITAFIDAYLITAASTKEGTHA
jgi:hypothetical protein